MLTIPLIVVFVLIGGLLSVSLKRRRRRRPSTKAYSEAEGQNSITIHLDVEDIAQSLKKHEERRQRIMHSNPVPLTLGSIRTVRARQGENPNSLSKYPVHYIEGVVGEDHIEAAINSNPRAKLVPFAVNRPVWDYTPSKQHAGAAMYNTFTGEIQIDFPEDEFMKNAIAYWINEEYQRIVKPNKGE